VKGTVADVEITALAAGGDGVGRVDGKVTFVAYTAVGDRVRARVVEGKAGWQRAEVVEVIAPSGDRVAPPCAVFGRCGGCQWQHVARPAQLAAKQAIVAGALRKAIARGLEVAPILDPAPAYGWRRRARLHVAGGAVGFFAARTHAVVDAPACPQLDPALDRAVAAIRGARPPDGELDVAIGAGGDVVVATRAAWPDAAAVVGTAGIVGVEAGGAAHGTVELELEPGLWARASDFAQASAAGNAVLVAEVVRALGPARGALLELYAGGGNFTRALVAAGWDVTAADVVAPRRPIAGARWLTASATDAVSHLAGQTFAAVLLDPPRTGAPEVAPALAALAPHVVYVSCDPATLGRDLERIQLAPRRALPLDLMPQTAHVEVIATLG
jgi:23S rRNA (uracil1939-C5)-methyltransferase